MALPSQRHCTDCTTSAAADDDEPVTKRYKYSCINPERSDPHKKYLNPRSPCSSSCSSSWSCCCRSCDDDGDGGGDQPALHKHDNVGEDDDVMTMTITQCILLSNTESMITFIMHMIVIIIVCLSSLFCSLLSLRSVHHHDVHHHHVHQYHIHLHHDQRHHHYQVGAFIPKHVQQIMQINP